MYFIIYIFFLNLSFAMLILGQESIEALQRKLLILFFIQLLLKKNVIDIL